ncbi:MAG: hypothetical protein PHI51_04925 [Candidatus Peribacteraceae bacterium]|nr:hypothetical protein [Candidatus Peribacteraceae bacterium]
MRRSLSLLLGLCFLLCPLIVEAERQVDLYLFWGDGCPHCAAEREALQEKISRQYPQLKIHEFEIYLHPANARLLQRVGEHLHIDVGGIPLTIIGDRVFAGFSPSITLDQITARIEECLQGGCPDSLAPLLRQDSTVSEQPLATDKLSSSSVSSISSFADSMGDATEPMPQPLLRFSIPFLGEVDARSLSLPLLAVVMGILDGFNPCALWTLLFLLSLLLGMASRVRMWILGSTFIVASALVYFLFMTAWLHLVLFLGFILWVRLAIAGIALAGGGYSFLKGLRQESGCIVEGDERRERMFERLKHAVQQQSFIFALCGIIFLAFAVNLVELICSAGLPAVFTQVLAINALSAWQSYALIVLYIFFFMIDDLFIFFATMVTLEMTGITTKYTRISHLVGGALMVAIGILLIFKPGWLMFG